MERQIQLKNPLIEMTQFPKRLGHPEEYASLAKHIVENPFFKWRDNKNRWGYKDGTKVNGNTCRLFSFPSEGFHNSVGYYDSLIVNNWFF